MEGPYIYNIKNVINLTYVLLVSYVTLHQHSLKLQVSFPLNQELRALYCTSTGTFPLGFISVSVECIFPETYYLADHSLLTTYVYNLCIITGSKLPQYCTFSLCLSFHWTNFLENLSEKLQRSVTYRELYLPAVSSFETERFSCKFISNPHLYSLQTI